MYFIGKWVGSILFLGSYYTARLMGAFRWPVAVVML